MATELGHVLQLRHDTLDAGHSDRTRVPVQHDQKLKLDWKPQLLDRRHPTRMQRLVALVWSCSRNPRNRRQHHVGTRTA
jgi:hypothetical protein